ncbi:MAG: methyltransferase domain-containing protein [bacterium]
MPSPKIQNEELRPYLPYLLKDLWEMGNVPAYKFELLNKNLLTSTKPSIIDLGCGKGAELIQLAMKFKFEGTGIDIFPEFIEDANFRKRLNNCEHLNFVVDDFVKNLSAYKDFNIIIFEYNSKLFGSVSDSLGKIKEVLKGNKGYILLDTEVLNDGTKAAAIPGIDIYKNVKEQMIVSNFTILGYIYWNNQHISRQNEFNNICIARRVAELSEKEPEKEELFTSFLDYQKRKSQLMEKDLNCITWLLRTQ